MPRPPKCRWVEFVPPVTSFVPGGTMRPFAQEMRLSVEELEAIRLKDLEQLDGEQAAERMGVSRPTFQRILECARRKVAEALVEGKTLSVGGGNFQVAMRQFECTACGHRWEVPYGTGQRGVDMRCPSCSSDRIHRIDRGGRGLGGPPWAGRRGRPWCEGREVVIDDSATGAHKAEENPRQLSAYGE